MSSSSDSDEFFDAEDLTPGRHTNTKSTSPKPVHRASNNGNKLVRSDSEPCISTESTDEKRPEDKAIPSTSEIKQTRKKLDELRKRLEVEDEDMNDGNLSPSDSQTSSVDGLFASIGNPGTRTSHPFRIVEHDAISLQSMSSLGRVGRILGGTSTTVAASNNGKSMSTISQSSKESTSDSNKEMSEFPSTLTLSIEGLTKCDEATTKGDHVPLQEPDVIASTKASSSSGNNSLKRETNSESSSQYPVAPPRRKKRAKTSPSVAESPENSADLTSPGSTIESLTRDFEQAMDENGGSSKSRSSTLKSMRIENDLDLRAAIQGQYVVKPQDEDKSKAEGPSLDEINRIAKLKHELLHNQGNSLSSSHIGHSSLGSQRRVTSSPRGAKQRRRSAGDEEMIRQLNMFVRMRSDSGKPLSDIEILEQVTVLNLDTGERVPLSIAEDKLPQCINPLSLHIMRLTSEYVSTTSLDKEKESDEESIDSKQSTIPASEELDVGSVRKRTTKLKRFLGSTVKKTVHKAKSIAHEVSHARHKEDVMVIVDEVHPGEQNIKLKAANSHKGPYEFENTQHVQELGSGDAEGADGGHIGPIWCMKFSTCGRLLATAGQDRVLRVWVVKEAYPYFQAMRNKYAKKSSPTPSQENLHMDSMNQENASSATVDETERSVNRHIFMERPFCTYTGHTSDLLDVSWSKNYFLLSSSMDKTVRLWNITRSECLCCFQHIDFVTAIVFHPRDDRYFLSGSLDGKLRLWNIPDKKVAVWNEVDGQTKLITAANFCQNGKFAVVGSYDGRCIFYITDQLKYHTQIHVRSTRGRNATGRKISGIEPMPGEDKILVTSNDSRIRLYDLRDLNLSCKYKGYVNVSSQIKASFSHDGKYIVSGSENRDIYVWKTNHDYSKFSSVRRDRNDFWEAIKAHNAVVTCAVFAPNPDAIIKMVEDRFKPNEYVEDQEQDPVVEQHTKGCGGHVLVSADFNGCIKVFINKMKPKHSSLPASALA